VVEFTYQKHDFWKETKVKIVFSANILPLSWLIRLWCMSSVSHVQFEFSDGVQIFPSVEVGRTVYTRNKNYTWEYPIELNIGSAEEKIIRDWAESQIGKPYDYTALAPLNVLIPRKKKAWRDDDRWMCSEFCAYGLELIGANFFEENYKKVKPSDLYSAIRKTNLDFFPKGL
jgi:hypothetical protein